ncbi:hypothetical protein KPH14_000789 [Odynerus spinipes]|uniref:Uncharacterized protein n=1 Tax=Odynerus spinipes TaxID=1348599 RepID=A0AAD9RD83_9HYME|nr:hypothetical protein KPH14_000789 [Odynerus spinipes]
MAEYFQGQIREAQYFDPPLTSYEINYSIIQQYPMRIRETLAVINYENTDAILQALEQVGEFQDEKYNQNERRKNNYRTENATVGHVSFHPERGRRQVSDVDYRRSRWTRNPYEYRNNARRGIIENQWTVNLPDTSRPPPNFSNQNNYKRLENRTNNSNDHSVDADQQAQEGVGTRVTDLN